jgi:uncharacterized membrane protein HdeD (DUF308 family)
VSVPDVAPARRARYWLIPVARAGVALAVAISITFTADHSARVGFTTFGAFALSTGLVMAGLSALRMEASIERNIFVASGVVSVLLGVLSLASWNRGVVFLLLIIGAWAAVTGFLELYCGVRARRSIDGHKDLAKDWLFSGAITAVLAIVAVLIPAGFEERFTGPDGIERALTASVIIVGSFGAYAAIIGVYLAIAGLSLKWGTQNAAVAAAGSSN